MARMRSLLLLIGCLLAAAPLHGQKTKAQKTQMTRLVDRPAERYLTIETPAGPYRVWTKKMGDNPNIKILLLHGGPGMTHEYWENCVDYFGEAGFEFYFYDQLGSHKSDQPDNPDLWVTERFVEEVEQVRRALGLDASNFFLMGHSWGGILAMEYALKYQDNLKGLIISNMMASSPDYDRYADEVLATRIPSDALAEIRKLEANEAYDDPRYMELLMEHHYPQHVLRLEEWPDPVVRALENYNPQVYVLMQGPSEFGIGGRLAEWDRKADLPEIEVPTLTIGATYDTMDPKHMEWMAQEVQNGAYLHCPEGSHLAMWDDEVTYYQGVVDFVQRVDRK